MIEILWTIFKGILLVFGILVVADVIIQMLLAPFKKKKQKETVDKIVKELDKIADECIEELMKEQENKKKTTTKTRKKKEN